MEDDKEISVLERAIQHAQTTSNVNEESLSQENTTSQENAEEQSQTLNQEATGEKETQPEAKKRGRPKKEVPASEETKSTEEEKQTAPAKKKFWEDEESSETAEDKTDYKSLWEQSEAKLQRFESKPVLEQLADAMEADDFDADKFFESYKPKDFKEFSLEELWKMQKKTTSNVEYSDEELDELWNEEYEAVSGSEAKKKALKDKLISELRPKVDLGKEPEYVSNLKKTVSEQREARKKQDEAFSEMINGLMSYTDGLEGAEIVEGLAVTKEDIESAKASFKPGYYINKDGTPNIKKMGNDKIKALMFDKLIGHIDTMATMKAKQEVYRPNLDSVSSDVNDQENTKHSETVVKSIIKNHDLLKK